MKTKINPNKEQNTQYVLGIPNSKGIDIKNPQNIPIATPIIHCREDFDKQPFGANSLIYCWMTIVFYPPIIPCSNLASNSV